MTAKIEQQLRRIRERNRRVEDDKAWETSATRKFTIAILTYFVIVLFFHSSGLSNPWINAIVPTVGFLLSTLSLPFFKKLWLRYVKR